MHEIGGKKAIYSDVGMTLSIYLCYLSTVPAMATCQKVDTVGAMVYTMCTL